jgi:hypothetical protein
MGMESWSEQDEEQLQALVLRKQEIMKRKMAPLIALIDFDNLDNFDTENIAEIMAKKAADYIAIGQGSAACGASPAPTGCATRGEE